MENRSKAPVFPSNPGKLFQKLQFLEQPQVIPEIFSGRPYYMTVIAAVGHKELMYDDGSGKSGFVDHLKPAEGPHYGDDFDDQECIRIFLNGRRKQKRQS
ncbi:MAG: hypothetical protein LBE10_07900 [Treponema sp.]|nr:hypothetical protein [Treponema sp.]